MLRPKQTKFRKQRTGRIKGNASKNLDLKKKSQCWDLTDKDKEIIKTTHSTLTFPKKGEKNFNGNGFWFTKL